MAVPNGTPAWAWFDWGLAGALTNRTAATSIGAGSGVVFVRQVVAISNSIPNAAYEYRLVVGKDETLPSAFGPVQRFTVGAKTVGWGDAAFNKTIVPSTVGSVVQLGAGWDQSFAVRPDGSLAAWGAGVFGMTNVPATLSNVVSVSSGQYHVLALQADGWPVAWGYSSAGQAVVPYTYSNMVMVAAGSIHNVALRANGTVACWGGNTFGQRNVPAALTTAGSANVVSVTAGAGGEHNLALRADGTVVAWGRNDAGQSTVPAQLTDPTTAKVVAVAAGGRHSLALRADGTLVAWGLNNSNQCNVAGLTGIRAIAAGFSHNVALKADGSVITWGGNLLGQTNQPQALQAVIGLVAGNNHSLAMGGFNVPPLALPLTIQGAMHRDSLIVLRGNDPERAPLSFRIASMPGDGVQYRLYQYAGPGQRGARITLDSALVNDPNGRVLFEPVSPNYSRSYATFTFVVNDGNSDSDPAQVTVQVERFLSFTLPPTEVRANSARLNGVVAPDGLPSTAWFEWGIGRFDRATPVTDVGAGGGLVRVSFVADGLLAGGLYQCRLAVSNALTGTRYATRRSFTTGRLPLLWGYSLYGQTNRVGGRSNLAFLTVSNAISLVPGAEHLLTQDAFGNVRNWGSVNYGLAAVPDSAQNALLLAAGGYHSLALRQDATIVAWGNNVRGQTNVPPGLSNVVMLSAGDLHTLALRADGTVAAWGYNSQGQTTVPAGLDNVVAVAAGASHSLALRGDGTVVAWGDNTYGETTVPAGLADVVDIAGGGMHSLALRSDGTVVGWGNNTSGQLQRPDATFATISAGTAHSLAIEAVGAVDSWGYVPPMVGLARVAVAVAGNQMSGVLGGLNLAPQTGSLAITGAVGTDLFITLPAQDLDGDALSCVIKSFPARGGLYQLDPNTGGRGAAITPDAPTVLDPARRLVFAPGPGETGVPYANFEFAVSDGAASSAARVVVTIPGSVTDFPPVILQPPQSKAVLLGAPVMFSVIATGSPPPSFQWQRNGLDLPGETAATLAIQHVAASMAGAYRVIVSNSVGRVISQSALLTVVSPPQIVSSSPNSFSATVLSGISITNVLVWPLAPQPPGTYRFTFCGVPPVGASINPTNGVLRWIPRLEQSHQDFSIQVCVTSLIEPAWTVSTTFDIAIEPYLRFSIGTTATKAGSTGSVPIEVSSSASFSNLVSVLLTSDERLTEPHLVHPVTRQPVGEVLAGPNGRWELRFDPNSLVLQGSNLVASLEFKSTPSTVSTAVPLTPVQISATEAGGIPIAAFVTSLGRVILIGSEDAGFLEAHLSGPGGAELILFGAEGANYAVQMAANLGQPTWQSVWAGAIPSDLTTRVLLTNLPPASPVFFRLKRQ